MLRTFLVLCLVAAACGIPRWNQRILGGDRIDIKDAPYQVALLLDWKGAGTFSHVCGGTIIKEDVILTAAQCPENTKPSQWRVRAGSTTATKGGVIVEVSQFIIHPLYNDNFDNDIALYFLKEALEFSSSINSAFIPQPNKPVPENAVGDVTGWGSTTVSGNSVDNLHKASIPIMPQQQCSNIYGSMNPVTPRMFCGGNADNSKSPCYGDFGGPMVIYGEVVGVTSWGLGCVMPNYPGVWTRVSAYSEWIRNYVHE